MTSSRKSGVFPVSSSGRLYGTCSPKTSPTGSFQHSRASLKIRMSMLEVLVSSYRFPCKVSAQFLSCHREEEYFLAHPTQVLAAPQGRGNSSPPHNFLAHRWNFICVRGGDLSSNHYSSYQRAHHPHKLESQGFLYRHPLLPDQIIGAWFHERQDDQARHGLHPRSRKFSQKGRHPVAEENPGGVRSRLVLEDNDAENNTDFQSQQLHPKVNIPEFDRDPDPQFKRIVSVQKHHIPHPQHFCGRLGRQCPNYCL